MRSYSTLLDSINRRYNPDTLEEVNTRMRVNLADVDSDILRYIRLSMSEVDYSYTEKTLAAGEAAKSHLQNNQSYVSYEYQGSVMTRTHIRGVSDIDLLTITEKFYDTEIKEMRKIVSEQKNTFPYVANERLQNYVDNFSSYMGNSLCDLASLRSSDERILKSIYLICDTSKPKAIRIKNTHYNREVDIVTASWNDSVNYVKNNDKQYRGIRIYDKELNQVLKPDYPFLSIQRINDRSAVTQGRLKKMIRFLKNLKADSGKQINLSSFDINAICYDIPVCNYINCHYLELIDVLFRQLYLICNNQAKADSIISVDGMEYIFRDKPNKINDLKLLLIELTSLISDINNI